MKLPYAHLNLRRNPFAFPALDQLERLAIVDIDRHIPKLLAGGYVVQFIGEQGRGKTTHMRTLHARVQAESGQDEIPYLYFPEDDPHPKIPWSAPILFLDETQRLSWWTRRKLWRSGKGLAIATHQNHRHEFERARMPHEVVFIEGLSVEKLERIVTARFEWARRGEGAIPWLAREDLEELIARFGDDLRAIELLLYDLLQQMERPERVVLPLES
ncbi:MAG: hypothetical protein VYE40_03775 [Myxococcota bacterium]|nr:hypothetical protein [Myxococcota bacterium]